MNDDLISRQAAIDAVETVIGDNRSISVCEAIRQLPPIQQKQGHWIANDDYDGEVYYTCSRCKELWVTIEDTPQENRMNYCPYCGARMEVTK